MKNGCNGRFFCAFPAVNKGLMEVDNYQKKAGLSIGNTARKS